MSYEVVLVLSTNFHVFKISLQHFCRHSNTSVQNDVNKQSINCHIIKHHPHHSQLDVHRGRSYSHQCLSSWVSLKWIFLPCTFDYFHVQPHISSQQFARNNYRIYLQQCAFLLSSFSPLEVPQKHSQLYWRGKPSHVCNEMTSREFHHNGPGGCHSYCRCKSFHLTVSSKAFPSSCISLNLNSICLYTVLALCFIKSTSCPRTVTLSYTSHHDAWLQSGETNWEVQDSSSSASRFPDTICRKKPDTTVFKPKLSPNHLISAK